MLPRRAGPEGTHGSENAAVRSTDSDALVSRAYAASLGYVDDPDAQLFLPPAQRRALERRPPLISIGTHARTWAVDRLVDAFLRQHAQVGRHPQVLSLGAGTDTRYWRLRRRWNKEGRDWACARWVEVDFPEATSHKARTIASKQQIKDALGGAVKIEHGGLGLSAPLYSLLPGDIRDLASLTSSLLSSTSTSPAPLSTAHPTLLLLECVLVYVPPAASDDLLRWFATTWGAPGAGGGAVVQYDPFGLEDKFGEVMKRNLAARNLSLPGAPSTPTLASFEERFRRTGTRGTTGSRTVREIREWCLPRAERERVGRIEQIDEVEELNLVLEHYAVAWGNLCAAGLGAGGEGVQIGLADASEEEGGEGM